MNIVFHGRVKKQRGIHNPHPTIPTRILNCNRPNCQWRIKIPALPSPDEFEQVFTLATQHNNTPHPELTPHQSSPQHVIPTTTLPTPPKTPPVYTPQNTHNMTIKELFRENMRREAAGQPRIPIPYITYTGILSSSQKSTLEIIGNCSNGDCKWYNRKDVGFNGLDIIKQSIQAEHGDHHCPIVPPQKGLIS